MTLTKQDFISSVDGQVKKAKKAMDWDDTAQKSQKVISHIVDHSGKLQFVDLVMEGGGVLGISLLGYTYVLEEVGIRFLNVAGTSAGAINAVMLRAAAQNIHSKSSTQLMEHLASMPLEAFMDGDKHAKALTDWFIQNGSSFFDENKSIRSSEKLKGLYRLWRARHTLEKHHGLHKGERFNNWLKDKLSALNVNTLADLNQKTQGYDGLVIDSKSKHRNPLSKPAVAMVATEILEGKKIELFSNNKNQSLDYWKNHTTLNPAELVRASMSIPLFFYPHIPKEATISHTVLTQPIFVDGGVVSNFPIYIFHATNHVPRAPTFGVRIDIEKPQLFELTRWWKMPFRLFDIAKGALDNEFIDKNRDYSQIVQSIDTQGIHWINFSLSDDDKITLFKQGAQAAVTFLEKFNWDDYLKLRANMLSSGSADDAKNANATIVK